MSRSSKAPPRKTHTSKRSGYVHHSYINKDGSIDGEWLAHLVRDKPGVSILMIANAAIEREHPERLPITRRIISGMCNLLIIAAQGDEIAQKQLQAIEKLIAPGKYELPLSKIQELIDRYETSPQLARAWELRKIMVALTEIVEPLKPEHPHGAIKMRNTPDAKFVGLADAARPFVKTNTTLQSLAIHIYLKHLQEEGITDEDAGITEASLKRDLRMANDWEKTATNEQKRRREFWRGQSFTDEPIIWYGFSEGWKERKKKLQKKKGGTKSSRS